jgi:hypothetical protein
MAKVERNISPAALGALAKGDIDNAMVAMTPGGIERQESEAQISLMESTNIPIKFNWVTRNITGNSYDKKIAKKATKLAEKMLKELGFKLGKPVDDLFREATLPEGWEKKASDHAMWSYIYDEKGRQRLSMFYKGAFYDRDAFLNFDHRYYSNTKEYVDKEGSEEWSFDNPDHTHEMVRWAATVVMDNVDDSVVFTSDIYLRSFESVLPKDVTPAEAAIERERQKWIANSDAAKQQALTWLKENKPDWEDPMYYWD